MPTAYAMHPAIPRHELRRPKMFITKCIQVFVMRMGVSFHFAKWVCSEKTSDKRLAPRKALRR